MDQIVLVIINYNHMNFIARILNFDPSFLLTQYGGLDCLALAGCSQWNWSMERKRMEAWILGCFLLSCEAQA
jgi:hypothetical protein